MTVSIVVPTYGRSTKMLERCLLSLLNQSYENIEIIVVDDNLLNLEDRKRTKEVVESLADDRIKVIYNKVHQGGSLSRNSGIMNSSGKYITFLDDDDDIYLTNKIMSQVKFMKKDDLDMSFSNLTVATESGKIINEKTYKLKSTNLNYLRQYHLTYQITGTPTFMYRKDFLLKIGMFTNTPMGQEFYLMVKTLEEDSVKIGYHDSMDCIAYVHNGHRISNGDNKIKGTKDLFVFKKSQWDDLSLKGKQYIKFKYNLDLAYAYLRLEKYTKSSKYVLISFICAPYSFTKTGIMLLKTQIKQKYSNKSILNSNFIGGK